MNHGTLLGTNSEVFIRQRRELVEIFVDWETKNQYAILDAAGEELGYVATPVVAEVLTENERPELRAVLTEAECPRSHGAQGLAVTVNRSESERDGQNRAD